MEKATMIKFNVQGMTCGGCARAVTDAVQQADPAASVDVEVAGKTVSVESSADPARLKAAIEDAGYTVAA